MPNANLRRCVLQNITYYFVRYMPDYTNQEDNNALMVPLDENHIVRAPCVPFFLSYRYYAASFYNIMPQTIQLEFTIIFLQKLSQSEIGFTRYD